MPIPVQIDAGGHRETVLRRRNELVEAHLDLARIIARALSASLPTTFDVEDLTQTAFLGLLKAATNYRPATHGGAPFEAYARPVIRGAVLDSVRRRHYEEHTRPSIVDCCEPSSVGDPEGEIDRATRSARIDAAVAELGERHRRVMRWHYQQGLRLLDVSRRLRVGRSRASQLHCEALRQVRAALSVAR